jgi:hypothetical protein
VRTRQGQHGMGLSGYVTAASGSSQQGQLVWLCGDVALHCTTIKLQSSRSVYAGLPYAATHHCCAFCVQHCLGVCPMQSKTDPTTCGTACSSLVNCTANLPANVDSAACPAGSCTVDSCASNHLNCNGQYKDGCETVSGHRIATHLLQVVISGRWMGLCCNHGMFCANVR